MADTFVYPLTKGAVLLARWMREQGLTQTDMAKYGVPQHAVSRWLRGTHLPRAVYAVDLERVTRQVVPRLAWRTLASATQVRTHERVLLDLQRLSLGRRGTRAGAGRGRRAA